MKKKNVSIGAVVNTLNVLDIITSLGINMLVWARILDEIDPNDSYETFMEIRDEMRLVSEVLAAVEITHTPILTELRLTLPSHIGAEVRSNPLSNYNEKRQYIEGDDIPF